MMFMAQDVPHFWPWNEREDNDLNHFLKLSYVPKGEAPKEWRQFTVFAFSQVQATTMGGENDKKEKYIIETISTVMKLSLIHI